MSVIWVGRFKQLTFLGPLSQSLYGFFMWFSLAWGFQSSWISDLVAKASAQERGGESKSESKWEKETISLLMIDQVTEHGSKPGNFSLILGRRGREEKDKIIPSDFLRHVTYIANFKKGTQCISHRKKSYWYMHWLSLERYPRKCWQSMIMWRGLRVRIYVIHYMLLYYLKSFNTGICYFSRWNKLGYNESFIHH